MSSADNRGQALFHIKLDNGRVEYLNADEVSSLTVPGGGGEAGGLGQGDEAS